MGLARVGIGWACRDLIGSDLDAVRVLADAPELFDSGADFVERFATRNFSWFLSGSFRKRACR